MKRWSIIWELIKINLLYANPQALASIKKKQNKHPNQSFSAYKSILRQQVLSGTLLMFLYGFLLSSVDYTKSSAYLSMQIGAFFFITLIYLFISLFSVFYDSRDTKLYLPLPVTSDEIYLAKLLSSQGMGLSFLSPILIFLTIAYWQTNQSLLSPLIALVMFGILLATSNAISLIFLFFVGKLLAKSPYKKIISSLFLFLGVVLSGAVIGVMQIYSNISLDGNGSFIGMTIPYFRGFYDVYLNPFSQTALLHFWLGIVVLIAVISFIRYRILPHYISQSLDMDAVVITKRRPKKGSSNNDLNGILVRHHLSTVKEPTLIMQNLLAPLLPLFMSASALLGGGLAQLKIDHHYFGIVLLIGIFIGTLSSSFFSFLGVGMSLERDNYHFMKSLPIDFRFFTIQKFIVLASLQLLFPILLYSLVALFVLKLPLSLILILNIGIILSTCVFGEWVYSRDHRLLMLNWQNINQLFYRGGGQWLMAVIQLLVMLLGMVLIIVSVGLTTVLSPMIVSTILTGILLALLITIHMIIWKTFWKKLV